MNPAITLRARNLSELDLSESLFSTKQKIFVSKTGIFQKESFRNHFLIPLESFRRNLSEWNLSELFLQNRNISEKIFQKICF
jgi:uncharacterized protein YjbI with pentapeptide repeats